MYGMPNRSLVISASHETQLVKSCHLPPTTLALVFDVWHAESVTPNFCKSRAAACKKPSSSPDDSRSRVRCMAGPNRSLVISASHEMQLVKSCHLPPRLQALVYDILSSTTAVFSYAIGPRKLSANEQFFCWCSNSSTFVTNNSNYIRRLFYNWPCCLRQLK